MPQIAELKEIDGSVWARVPMEFGSPIQILSPVEIEANQSRESRYLDEIERLLRRVKVLEMVIYEELQPDFCDDIANRTIVEGIHERE